MIFLLLTPYMVFSDKFKSCTKSINKDEVLLTLECSKSNNTTKNVTVNLDSGIFDCSNFPPILGGAEDRTILANGTSSPLIYDGNFSSFQQIQNPPPWPGHYGDTISLSLNSNKYISARFNSGTSQDHGKFILETPSNYEGPIPGSVTTTISHCPGSFSEAIGGQERCVARGGTIPSLFWSNDQDADTRLFCILQPNTTYYLNIVHSNTVDNNYSTSGCSAAYCGILAGQTTVDL